MPLYHLTTGVEFVRQPDDIKSWDWAKSEAVHAMTSEWRDLFSSSQVYCGWQFLNLTQGRNPLVPSHLHDGPWLSISAGKGFVPTNAFMARLTRAILNHAPTGEFRA